jgi:hypothetical protein
VRFGWRGACFTYAAIQIAVALPIHLLALPTATKTEAENTVEQRQPVHLRRDEYATFGLLTAVLTLSAAVLSIVGTQLLPILTARGFEMSVAAITPRIIIELRHEQCGIELCLTARRPRIRLVRLECRQYKLVQDRRPILAEILILFE